MIVKRLNKYLDIERYYFENAEIVLKNTNSVQ